MKGACAIVSPSDLTGSRQGCLVLVACCRCIACQTERRNFERVSSRTPGWGGGSLTARLVHAALMEQQAARPCIACRRAKGARRQGGKGQAGDTMGHAFGALQQNAARTLQHPPAVLRAPCRRAWPLVVGLCRNVSWLVGRRSRE